jgi:hypothetical protein
MQQVEKSSLYDRLGGVYSIATVVNDFINRIMIDPRLNSNPLVDAAHHRVPPAGFKYLVTEMVCWAYWWSAEVYGQVDGGISQGFEDYGQRVGSVPGRFSADAGQLRGSRRGAS